MKILVVDDDENIRLIASYSLVGDDVHVIEAASGAAALELAKDEVPDVILLDMMMPNMDGKTTLARLKECPETKPIPVIFFTAKVQAHEMETYIGLGAAGVIMKPFDPISLLDQVVVMLEKH
ncbi:MAG: response regulator [Candidatus Obscuribacterales bacterium]|nr:response regulator [Candidatus Obscuribacterales bacterium]